MAKLTLTDIAAGYNTATAHNANNTLIEAAIENTLSRDGTTPNSMNADLDMNGYSILNQKATSGDVNFSWLGDWTTGTTYSINNLVFVTLVESSTNGGSAYICVTDHTAGATFDGDLSANWELFTQQGEDGAPGAGTGDVVGPAGAVADNVATYDGTTGKLIKDSGVALGTMASQASNNVAISGGSVTGITDLAVADGGTGVSTFTDAGVLIGNGTGAIQATTAGTSGQVLTSNGAGVDPTFQAAASGAWELISSTSITAVTNLDVTIDETTYIGMRVVIEDAKAANDNINLRARMLYDNGASVMTTGYTGTGGGTYMQLTSDNTTNGNVGNAGGEEINLTVELHSFATAAGQFYMESFSVWDNSAGGYDSNNELFTSRSGASATERTFDGIRFYWQTGAWQATGTIKVYGLKRA